MRGKKYVSVLLAIGIGLGGAAVPVWAQDTQPTASIRQMETLGRGLAVVRTENGNYLSWRLLGSENQKTSFRIYRDGSLIATEENSTNYIDEGATSEALYQIEAVQGDVVGEKSEAAGAFSSGTNYFDIPLRKPADFQYGDSTYSYEPGDASCGDLDNDGEYELIVKWDANPQDNSNDGVTGNVYLDAYKLDGTPVWDGMIDLGPNIRGGAHYTQFMVYDLDGDGRAEIACKTAPGSKDALGGYVSGVSLDDAIKTVDDTKIYRNDAGRILDGPEFYTVFAGDTGKAVDTVAYPVPRGAVTDWGDSNGNRADRFLGAIAYLDGVTPSVVAWRGYYTRTTAVAFNLVDGRLEEAARFDTNDAGMQKYAGQGNHNLTVADVDGDGKDEIICGSLCLDDDFSVKWCSFRGHGDALHIGDYDPTHEGLEYFSVHESGGSIASNGVALDYGMTVYDAATGEELFHQGSNRDTGRGIMANVGAGGYYQIMGAGTYKSVGDGTFQSASVPGNSVNFRIFWDGDLYDEMLDGTTITAWDNTRMTPIFTADGCRRVNGTKATPALQADLFGDWREEVVYPLSDNSALRVYMSTEMTKYKLPTLMSDPVYRQGVAAENVAYNQPPHIGYYLSEDLFNPPIEGITMESAPDKTVYQVGEKIDLTGLSLTAHYEDGTQGQIDTYAVSGYDANAAGQQTVTVEYRGKTAEFTVEVVTELEFNKKTGAITGYRGTASEVTVPSHVNGVAVTKIAAGVFSGDSEWIVTVPYEVETIEEGAFSEQSTIRCYDGSEAQVYAVEHGIACELLPDTDKEYLSQVSFDEAEYQEYAAGSSGIVLRQTGNTQALSVGDINYTVGGRRGGGDGKTGFTVLAKEDGSRYLQALIGRFSGSGRNASLTVGNSAMLGDSADFVFETNIRFPEDKVNGHDAQMTISDGKNVVDTVTKEGLGVEYDTWYRYQLIYRQGQYGRALFAQDGTLIGTTSLDSESSGMGVSQLAFVRYGNTGYTTNAEYAAVDLDDLQLYFIENAFGTAQICVNGSYTGQLEGAAVMVAGKTYTTDKDGIVDITLPVGVYQAQIQAEDCEEKTIGFAVRGKPSKKQVVLNQTYYPIESVTVEPESVTVAQGQMYQIAAQVLPDKASVRDLVWTSDQPEIADVSSRGVVLGKKVGTAVISATSKDGNKTDTCTVTVEERWDPFPADLRILGGQEKIVIPEQGEVQSKQFFAQVLDRYGRVMEDEQITWDIEQRQGVSVSQDGIVTVSAEAEKGRVFLIAQSYGVEVNIPITLSPVWNVQNFYEHITFDEQEYNGFHLIMAGEDQDSVVGDITYHVGGRAQNGSPAGDKLTGFELGTGGPDGRYLKAQAGEYSNSNRNAYLMFPEIADYDAAASYVLEMDMMFVKSEGERITKDMTCGFRKSDGTLIGGFTQETLGVEENQWYHYRLLYNSGAYTELVYTMDGQLLSQKSRTDMKGQVSGLNFTSAELTRSYYAQMGIENLRYYQITDAYSQVQVTAKTTDATPVSGADIYLDGIKVAQTNTRGIAQLSAFLGSHTLTVKADGQADKNYEFIADGEAISYTVMYGVYQAEKAVSALEQTEGTLSGSVYVDVSNPQGEAKRVMAVLAIYDDGCLVSVKTREVLIGENGTIVPFEGIYAENVKQGSVKVLFLDDLESIRPNTNAVEIKN